MPPSEANASTSQSLERGLAILSSFHSDRPLIDVSELSRELELSRSTALERIRTSGIAVNDEGLAYELRSIAATIHSHSGEVLAALNLAVHRTMVSMDELIARLGPVVAQTAHDISVGMGHRLAPA
jgi:DNA-binding IclR family transcriptional regulator